ncbi:alpha-glucan phosphorylase 2, cytosolic [Nicotiana attenuata]|uniref:Alpha-1,4 glucan phosphorylase n=1 Tax=Nicotiana attenuata TaxID=49451 RepID=A0A314LF44_NICAT|nr:alpha-glucan phosphorylase 2, cytosolic [Nicotiana attenuata]
MAAISVPLLTLRSPQANRPFPSFFNLNRPFSTSLSSNCSFNHLTVSNNSSTSSNQAITETTTSDYSTINVQNDDALDTTLFVIRAKNRIGLLQIITRVFKVLGLTIQKAIVEFEGEFFVNKFFVSDSNGMKIEKTEHLEKIQKALKEAIDTGGVSPSVAVVSGRGVVVRKAGLNLGERKAKAEKMFGLMDGFLKNDAVSLQKDILDHVEFTVARSRFNFDDFEAYQALAHSVRDRLIERWHDTHQYFKKKDPKRLYFLSLEFLMGRSLTNSVINLGIQDQYADALSQLGFDYEVLAEQEGDAALGNGGLARLAACQMDSLATLDYPAWGYGLRYQYGLFRQIIVDGFQHEQPDFWLNFGNPWEIERVHVSYPVKNQSKQWLMIIQYLVMEREMPSTYDFGLLNQVINMIMESYTTGDYINAIVNRQKAETISNVLYPDDRSYQGKELRLKQQYFFVSASLQDIIRRFKDLHNNFDEFPEKVALQINDTHPSIAIAEVMRVLVDEEHLDWSKAWGIACKIFSVTIHAVQPEALEKVPIDLLGSVLPRHLEIIYEINYCLMEELKKILGQDYDKLSRMSIIEEGAVKCIRMANLSLACCHTVNGVSRLHLETLKTRVFKDFYELWPQKFQFKTNGVTQVHNCDC